MKTWLSELATRGPSARDRTHLIWPYIFATAFNVVANLIFIPGFSYWGAAVVTVLTELLVLVISLYIVRKYLQLSLNWTVLGKTLFSSLVMGGILYYFRDLSLWWLIILGTVVYTGMVVLTKAVSWQEIKEIIPRLSVARK